MDHDQLAKDIAQASAKLKRRMDRAEEARADLCRLLKTAAGAACSTGAISSATQGEVVAPKDENDGSGG